MPARALFPYRCGRLDAHTPHDWQTPPLGSDWPQRTYHCAGYVLTETELSSWDAADDAAEEEALQARREATR